MHNPTLDFQQTFPLSLFLAAKVALSLSHSFIRQSIVLLLFRVSLPGEFYELNVHFGVLVGGMGDFSEIFLGNQETFRGCMEDVLFNGIDVLDQARRVSGAVTAGFWSRD